MEFLVFCVLGDQLEWTYLFFVFEKFPACVRFTVLWMECTANLPTAWFMQRKFNNITRHWVHTDIVYKRDHCFHWIHIFPVNICVSSTNDCLKRERDKAEGVGRIAKFQTESHCLLKLTLITLLTFIFTQLVPMLIWLLASRPIWTVSHLVSMTTWMARECSLCNLTEGWLPWIGETKGKRWDFYVCRPYVLLVLFSQFPSGLAGVWSWCMPNVAL